MPQLRRRAGAAANAGAALSIPRILIIAGSDSGGGAGIQADIKTVTMLGGHAMTAITAITAQNTMGVSAVHLIPAEMVIAQVDAVVGDLGVDAIKIGMMGSPETVEALTVRLELLPRVPIVFDPVMVATSGAPLADRETIAAFEQLIAISALVTPNLPELEALTERRLATIDQAEDAARHLARYNGTAVLAKGGHFEGETLTDILVQTDGESIRWNDPRIETRHAHGTGCTLASAIAVGLATGSDLPTAVAEGRAYVRAAMEAGPGFGAGHGPMGHALGVSPFEVIHRKQG